MTFDEYLRAVFDYFMIGGVTWEQSYMRVLLQKRPTLYNKIVNVEKIDPAESSQHLGEFIHLTYANWKSLQD